MIWKPDLKKQDFFHAMAVGTNVWMHHLDEDFTRMLHVLNKSWKQHLTKQLLYGHIPPISQTFLVRQTRNAGKVRKN